MSIFKRWIAVLFMLVAISGPGRLAAAPPTIKLGYVEGWTDSVASTHVVAQIIRRELGYEVKTMPVSAGLMWQGIARGDLDASLSAWLPATHAAYHDKLKDKVVDLAVNFPNARIGLIVPEYVGMQSIEELVGKKAMFEGRIVGIDAGAGVMTKTEQAIREYGLDYRLVPSSGSGMTAELERAIRAHKPIVVTGWVPHWMFAKWKLKFLDDPKKIFGDAEHVDTIVNPMLQVRAAPVYELLKNFAWKPGEIDGVMLALENGEKPEAAAQKWIAAHPQRVKEWLPSKPAGTP